MAADVHAVVTELGLHRPAIVGCNMGGTIARQYALDYPADVSRLVVPASFGWRPEAMSQSVDEQMAFIRDHTLREIAENRIGAASESQRNLSPTLSGRAGRALRAATRRRVSRPPGDREALVEDVG